MLIEIKSVLDGKILFSIETSSWPLAVEAAIKAKTDLSYADLRSANLRSADLSSADLRSAKGIIDTIYIGRIGSRNDCLVAILKEKSVVEVIAGCWKGNLEEFEARVKEVHKDDKHGRAYMAAIELIRVRFGVMP